MYRRSLAAFFIFGILSLSGFAHAQTKEEIQSQINDRNKKIQQLEAEIAQVQKDLDATSKDKQTLQTAVKTIDLSRKQVTSSITLTQTKIKQKDTEISGLASNITTTAEQISDQQDAIGQSLRDLDSEESNGHLSVALLAGQSIGDFFGNLNSANMLRTALGDHILQLGTLKSSLQSSKTTAEQKRSQLAGLKSQLAEQQHQLDITRQQKAELLTTTKNKETSYQSLLKQKKAEQSAFESELIRLAASLGIADTSSAPSAHKGILAWPLDSVSITQYFGNTEFAQSGAYSGNGHNGIDFRAAIGTPIKAALTGIVQEVNQGAVKYCQYGKWVLVKHNNGLTTLYAHLSSITVTKGQVVQTGDLLGYSGDTGYATGPHLHLTVYVSSAVTFKQYTCNSGSTAYIPIAPLNAYLNPLLYL